MTDKAPPPRTQGRRQLRLLESPLIRKPLNLHDLEKEKADSGCKRRCFGPGVLAQSNALMALVGQIASASGDLMTGLSGIGSWGASTRAKLQAELACHRATFYTSVLQQMSRRMAPPCCLWMTLPGEVSRLWPSSRTWSVSVSCHDDPRLPHDGQSQCCQRLHGSISCGGTNGAGQRKIGGQAF